MIRLAFILCGLTLFPLILPAQFAPAAGLPGSTAVAASDPRFVAWAEHIELRLGRQDISDSMSPLAATGQASSAAGAADGSVVSLGDQGEAIVALDAALYNGPGFDFAVFENGFPSGAPGLAFLEFAEVGVSSDGIQFVMFPSQSLLDTSRQMGLEPCDAALVHNLAGKYVGGQGTPFELDELPDTSVLDKNQIRYILIRDVVGSVDTRYGTRDSRGRLINDPWPTPFPSSGFDLDAVGLIHVQGISQVHEEGFAARLNWKNPQAAGEEILLFSEPPVDAEWSICDVSGRRIAGGQGRPRTASLTSGLYFLRIQNETGHLLVW